MSVIEADDDNASQDLPVPPSLSPLTESDNSLPVPLTANKLANDVVPSSLKRKRALFDCVEVPNARYKIKRRIPSTQETLSLQVDQRPNNNLSFAFYLTLPML
ncbi:hypothetical protein C0991_003924 [Blastosporella zonata]|nr:hypothetical protein C0991_003924 [Blastosporella zonata]